MKFKLVEENELEKRAKYHRKRQKGMSPFYSPDGGNVPLAMDKFNNSVSDGANGLCEDFELLDSEPVDISYKDFYNLVDTFFQEYKSVQAEDNPDIMYDIQRNFYRKYRPFVDKCKNVMNSIKATGYGRNDYYLLKIWDLCKVVDNNFPYGWKPRNYKNESLKEDLGTSRKAQIVLDYYDEHGLCSEHVEDAIATLWPDYLTLYSNINELPEKKLATVYDYIVDKYQTEIDIYGDDADLPSPAYDLFKDSLEFTTNESIK